MPEGFIGFRPLDLSCRIGELPAGGSQVHLGRCGQLSKDQLLPVRLGHRCDKSWRWHVPMQLGSCSRLGNEFGDGCALTGVWLRIGRIALVGL
jgi:hypothetical protein